MKELKKYLIDEKTVSHLESILSMLAMNESQQAFFELDSVINDIVTWCEVKEK